MYLATYRAPSNGGGLLPRGETERRSRSGGWPKTYLRLCHAGEERRAQVLVRPITLAHL
jgi:hypothetical protein